MPPRHALTTLERCHIIYWKDVIIFTDQFLASGPSAVLAQRCCPKLMHTHTPPDHWDDAHSLVPRRGCAVRAADRLLVRLRWKVAWNFTGQSNTYDPSSGQHPVGCPRLNFFESEFHESTQKILIIIDLSINQSHLFSFPSKMLWRVDLVTGGKDAKERKIHTLHGFFSIESI